MIGIIMFSYVFIFLLSPKDITDYTIADTVHWGETKNRLMLKTAYEYNSKEELQAFPKVLGDWNGYDFRYDESVYRALKADILLSRTYEKKNGSYIWIDIINSKVGDSFHNQKICLAGWDINNESISEFRIADPPNPFTKLYAKRLDYSKKNQSQIMVYWFMFKKVGSEDSVTMIRITTPVISNESNAFDSIKDFIENELFHTMYKQSDTETLTVSEDIINKYGNTGMAAMALALLIPAGLVFTGIRRKE
ncbi:MAG: exosortase-associated EpsI family protein [Candidatus Methanoperedens sp.]|nr:exosortase-associated EpsI family protein [Candidatus Methanoperedens sp.]